MFRFVQFTLTTRYTCITLFQKSCEKYAPLVLIDNHKIEIHGHGVHNYFHCDAGSGGTIEQNYIIVIGWLPVGL